LDWDIKRPIKNLSHGNKKKAGVIQALMHKPEILMLDEPTGGLDPLMQREVLRLIKEAQADGATVFFSSHNIAEVEAVADQVNIINAGIIAEVVDVSELLTRALRRARITFRKSVDTAPLLALPGVSLVSQENSTAIELQITGDMDPLIKALGKYPIVDVQTARPSLEDIFMAYYEAGEEEA
jgi:ABC-2 type transport system ATP-binding protein